MRAYLQLYGEICFNCIEFGGQTPVAGHSFSNRFLNGSFPALLHHGKCHADQALKRNPYLICAPQI